jgi:hypothetical protein
MKRATKTVEKTEEREQLKDCATMWLHKSKAGNDFLKGHSADGSKLMGFFNSKKNNPKEPDIRIYMLDEEGKAEEKACCSLWQSVSETKGTKYLTGSTNENEKVVGFYQNIEENEKRPYINVFFKKED